MLDGQMREHGCAATSSDMKPHPRKEVEKEEMDEGEENGPEREQEDEDEDEAQRSSPPTPASSSASAFRIFVECRRLSILGCHSSMLASGEGFRAPGLSRRIGDGCPRGSSSPTAQAA